MVKVNKLGHKISWFLPVKKHFRSKYILLIAGLLLFSYLFCGFRIFKFTYPFQTEEIGIILLLSLLSSLLLLCRAKSSIIPINLNYIDLLLGIIAVYYSLNSFSRIFDKYLIYEITCFPIIYIYFKSIDYRYVYCFFLLLIICSLIQTYLGFSELTEPWQTISDVRGIFSNSSVFGGFISICCLINVEFLFFNKTRNTNRLITIFLLLSLVILFYLLIRSNSRAGWLSLALGLLYMGGRKLKKNHFVSRWNLIQKGGVFVLILSGCLLFFYFLYNYKQNSTIGRLFIWEISLNIFKDFPVIGTGTGGFKASYMDYQAAYFKQNPGSPYIDVADDNFHAFNDFLKYAVEYGILGILLIIILLLLVYFFRKRKLKGNLSSYSDTARNILFAVIVFGTFSYPFEFIQFSVLVLFLLALISRDYSPKISVKIRKYPVFIFAMLCSVLMIFSFSSYFFAFVTWNKLISMPHEKSSKDFEILYPSLKHNAQFLITYAQISEREKEQLKSIDLLNEASLIHSKYEIQIALGKLYQMTGDHVTAGKKLTTASEMVPIRFLPDYLLMRMYESNKNTTLAKYYAERILSRKIKVFSPQIYDMKEAAKNIQQKIEQMDIYIIQPN